MQQAVEADDIQKGFLLAGKGGIRQILCGSGGSHRDRHSQIIRGQLLVGSCYILFQLRLERRLQNPAANSRAGCCQCLDVIDIQLLHGIIDTLIQLLVGQELPVGVRRGRKTVGHGNPGTAELAYHLSKGGVFTANPVDIIHTQLIEPSYIL